MLSNVATCGQPNSFANPCCKYISPTTMRMMPRKRGAHSARPAFVVCISLPLARLLLRRQPHDDDRSASPRGVRGMATPAQIAVITGAGSGIGRASAHALLEDGWTVVLAGRRKDMLDETAKLANAPPPRTLAVPTDVTDKDSIAALFDKVKATYGRIDLLFNNAGTSTRGIPFEDLTYEQWMNVVQTNLTGSFLCAQHAFRMMKEQDPRGGRIINNGSVSAHVPRRNSTPYVATKHALTGLTRSLSLDGRHLDIACGQIDIGNAATERNTDTSVGRLQATGKVEAEARIDVDVVANGVRYMASLPLDANVQFMTVMATKMPYIGRG